MMRIGKLSSQTMPMSLEQARGGMIDLQKHIDKQIVVTLLRQFRREISMHKNLVYLGIRDTICTNNSLFWADGITYV